MSDRIRTTRRRTSGAHISSLSSPIPMPGRLAVDYYDNLQKCSGRGRLDEQSADTRVTATGTLARVRFVGPAGQRAHALLIDADGDSALVDFSADAVAVIRPLLSEGVHVSVYGMAVPAASGTPAGIAGYNALIVSAR